MFSADYLFVLACCVAAVVWVIHRIVNETFDEEGNEGGLRERQIRPIPMEPAPEEREKIEA